MKVNTRYGVEISPDIDTVNSKTRCYYCNQNEDKPIKYMKNGEKIFKVSF